MDGTYGPAKGDIGLLLCLNKELRFLGHEKVRLTPALLVAAAEFRDVCALNLVDLSSVKVVKLRHPFANRKEIVKDADGCRDVGEEWIDGRQRGHGVERLGTVGVLGHERFTVLERLAWCSRAVEDGDVVKGPKIGQTRSRARGIQRRRTGLCSKSLLTARQTGGALGYVFWRVDDVETGLSCRRHGMIPVDCEVSERRVGKKEKKIEKRANEMNT